MVEDGTGRICACVAVDTPREGVAELHQLYVRPDRRGTGLGGRLVAFAEGLARAGGARSLAFWSDTRFLDAHRLYRRLGFRDTGRSRDLGDVSRSVEHEFEKDLA